MASHNRGEVWLTDLGYRGKTRPCLVLSVPAGAGDRALVTVVIHTTALRNTDFEVDVAADFLKTGAFDVQNIASVPHAKLIRKLGTLRQDQFDLVASAVLEWLGF
ncbi:MAG: type II toxin-antitoxin system PemK/MazF family toxin [Isosphaeraceae bacterium]